jgi:hypothetical protein
MALLTGSDLLGTAPNMSYAALQYPDDGKSRAKVAFSDLSNLIN